MVIETAKKHGYVLGQDYGEDGMLEIMQWKIEFDEPEKFRELNFRKGGNEGERF